MRHNGTRAHGVGDTRLPNITVDMMGGTMITGGNIRHKRITGTILVACVTLTVLLMVITGEGIITPTPRIITAEVPVLVETSHHFQQKG